jgi:VanZ family protein
MLATIDRAARPGSAPSLMRVLSLIALGAVLYATLYPWSDWRMRQPGAFAFLFAGIPRYWTWFDVASNVFAYLLLALVTTLGWLGSVRMRWAVPLAVLGLSAMSLGLEAMQSWLPGRVPSVLDWLSNSGGAVLGSMLGAALNRGARPTDRVAVPVRERWHEQGSPLGWVLLLLWLSAQLVPQRLLFATGQVQRIVDGVARSLNLEAELTQLSVRLSLTALDGVLLEAATVICAVSVIGLLALDLVRSQPHRALLMGTIALVALVLRSIATQIVYGAGSPFAWLTPGAQGGLVVGVLLLYAFATLGPRGRAVAAVALLVCGLLLVNLAPPDRYFDTTVGDLGAGQLFTLHALLRFVSMAWPFAAIAYFWARVGRRRRPRP